MASVLSGHTKYPTAANRTFLTPELLELILLHLPSREILVSCLRVCRSWHKVISNSPSLQWVLFFKPGQGPTAPPLDVDSYILNPFLVRSFPGWFTHFKIPAADWDILYGHLKDPPPPGAEFRSPTARFLVLPWNQKPHAWRRADASWRRMEISQPPIHHLKVTKYHCESFDEDDEYTEEGWINFMRSERQPLGGGMTVGELYDFVEDEVLRYVRRNRPNFRLHMRRNSYESADDQHGFAIGRGATLNVDFIYTQPCEVFRPGRAMPRFRSEGFQEVVVPMKADLQEIAANTERLEASMLEL